jgi:hypothetical protein
MESGAAQARSRLSAVVLILAVTTVAFFNAYSAASNLAQTSDSAQGFAVGHAIATGNLLLAGWHFPVDNFYLTDSLSYALAERIVGPRPYLLALIPALVYALLVLIALFLCVRPSQPLRRNVQPASIAVVLLAAPVWIGAWNPMLMSDMHTATVVAALAVLALCAQVAADDPGVSFRRLAAVLAFVLTALTVASDPFSLVFAFGPAVVVLGIEAALNPDLPNVRFVFLVLVVAIAAGLLAPWILAWLGGYTTENDVAFRFAATRQWWTNIVGVLFGLLTLWGANPLDVQSASDVPTLAIRWAALGFVLFTAVILLHKLLRGTQVALLDRLLCAGAVVPLVVCAPSAQFAKGVKAETMWHGGSPMRSLVPTVLFATVLACRQIAGVIDSVANARTRFAVRSTVVGLAGLALLNGVLQSLSGAARPSWIDRNPAITAARWLEQRGFSQGVGEYWSANLLTAMSGNMITVRSIVPEDGRLVPYVWVEDRAFYAKSPEFAVWQEPNQTGVTEAIVRATWPVCTIRTVAGYRIALLQYSRKIEPCPSA